MINIPSSIKNKAIENKAINGKTLLMHVIDLKMESVALELLKDKKQITIK